MYNLLSILYSISTQRKQMLLPLFSLAASKIRNTGQAALVKICLLGKIYSDNFFFLHLSKPVPIWLDADINRFIFSYHHVSYLAQCGISFDCSIVVRIKTFWWFFFIIFQTCHSPSHYFETYSFSGWDKLFGTLHGLVWLLK